MRSAGSSVGEIEWIERDREAGARSRVAVVVGATSSSPSELRRRSYTVVADGKHPGLIEEGRNRYREKGEGTGE